MVNSYKLLLSILVMAMAGVAAVSREAADFGAGTKFVQPAELAKELSNAKGTKPTILYVGPRFLFRGGHIPGAVFHGQAVNPDGLREMKQWVEGLPRTQSIVLYCGCCPWDHCPNIRPAAEALEELGFKQFRVLQIATDFKTDWIGEGYPVEK